MIGASPVSDDVSELAVLLTIAVLLIPLSPLILYLLFRDWSKPGE